MGDFVYAVFLIIGLTSAQEVTISNRPINTNKTADNYALHQKNVVVLPQPQFGIPGYENIAGLGSAPLTQQQFINNQPLLAPQFGPIGPYGYFQPQGVFGNSGFLPFFQNPFGQVPLGETLAPQPPPQVKEVQVPQPYPVYVSKPEPVRVHVRVPVEVPKPYPVKVPHPVPVPVKINVPVPVEKPYPVHITRTVLVPVEKPVYIRVPDVIQEPVAHPYPVGFFNEAPGQFNSSQFDSNQYLANTGTQGQIGSVQSTSPVPELDQLNEIPSKAESSSEANIIQSNGDRSAA